MTPDGVLTVTTPSGTTRTSRPPGLRSGILELLRSTRNDNRCLDVGDPDVGDPDVVDPAPF